MDKYIERRITVGNILEIVTIILAAVVFVVMIKSDVEAVKTKVSDIEVEQDRHLERFELYRRETVPNIYLRQDVASEQLKAIRAQLDRIEDKVN